ncbi:hypothetical protein HY989_03280 [Candidatus Micrarchaeota archaeon]|nr:hypothetical protein [Candidatus Micrarchaeota archaeon]
MRFFKHGETLAIVIPEKLRKSSEITGEDDFEFFEIEKGTLVLINRKNLEDQTKKSVIAKLLNRVPVELDGLVQAASLIQTPSASYSASSFSSSSSKTSPQPIISQPDEPEPEKLIVSRGFAVISSEDEARRISKLLEKEIKTNEVMGVRGFDKKFYIVSSQYYSANSTKILKAIGSKEMSLSDIAVACKLDERGCNACLVLLKEQGDLIEKRKGVFKLI